MARTRPLLPLLLLLLLSQATTASAALRRLAQPTSSAVWAPVALDAGIVQMALDAVSYRANYDRFVTTRVCLYRITSVKKRTANGITSYLLSVDGCLTSDVVTTGICDIYFCRLYSYELWLAQKSANNGLFVVQSVTKQFTQKSLGDLMLPGNLDIVDDQPDEGSSSASQNGSPEEAKANLPSHNISMRVDARPSAATLLSMVQTANAANAPAEQPDESPMQLILQWLWHWW